jgi:hypothetical protein
MTGPVRGTVVIWLETMIRHLQNVADIGGLAFVEKEKSGLGVLS